MPKFNPNTWKPTDDSSLGFRTTDPTRVVLNKLTREDRVGCPCGCATFPTGKDAIFSMGHDATFRGKMIRAHLMGVEIMVVYNGNEDDTIVISAMELAKQYGQKKHLVDAEMRREAANRTVASKALKAGEAVVQIGKWKYTGQVVAFYRTSNPDQLIAEHVDRAGGIRRTRVNARGIDLVTA